MGATVSHILVCDLESDTCYAKIFINSNGKSMEIDSRPSDAIALAVRAKVPIYAEETVLEKAGVLLDKETGKPILPGDELGVGQEEKSPEVKEEELRRMSAFTDFINSLDLEDFGKTPKGG